MRWLLRAAGLAVVAAAALLVAGLVSLAGYARVQSSREVTLPAPSGPDRVGRAVFDWTDPSRMDPYAAGRSTPRELSVEVWYPAQPAPGAATTTYLPPGWDRALAGRSGVEDALNGLAHTPPGLVHPHAVEDAPLAGGGPFPVLLLSPGLGLLATDYTATAEDLASHGYAVAGVDPTYSADVVLSGGRVVPSVARARDGAVYGQLVQLWAGDLSFVAGQLRAQAGTPGSRFRGRLATSRVEFFGHSAGGAAATLACRHDDRCAGALDIDGDPAGDVLQTGLGKPFLFLGDRNAISREPYLTGMLRDVLRGAPAADGHVLTVTGAGHDSFTDRAAYFNLFGSQLGFTGRIDGARALRITAACVGAFSDVVLRGQPPSLLTGLSQAYPEIHAEPV